MSLLYQASRIHSHQSIFRTTQSLRSAVFRVRVRHLQTQIASVSTEAEAFLEEAKPGVSFLSLNRPKAKNAISLRLLKVSGRLFFGRGLRVGTNSRDRNSGNVSKELISTNREHPLRIPSHNDFVTYHSKPKQASAFSSYAQPHPIPSAPAQTLPNVERCLKPRSTNSYST